MPDVDLCVALQASVVRYHEEQRRRDAEPCPSCQGDRLRPDFTGSGACHAQSAEATPATDAIEPKLVADLAKADAL